MLRAGGSWVPWGAELVQSRVQRVYGRRLQGELVDLPLFFMDQTHKHEQAEGTPVPPIVHHIPSRLGHAEERKKRRVTEEEEEEEEEDEEEDGDVDEEEEEEKDEEEEEEKDADDDDDNHPVTNVPATKRHIIPRHVSSPLAPVQSESIPATDYEEEKEEDRAHLKRRLVLGVDESTRVTKVMRTMDEQWARAVAWIGKLMEHTFVEGKEYKVCIKDPATDSASLLCTIPFELTDVQMQRAHTVFAACFLPLPDQVPRNRSNWRKATTLAAKFCVSLSKSPVEDLHRRMLFHYVLAQIRTHSSAVGLSRPETQALGQLYVDVGNRNASLPQIYEKESTFVHVLCSDPPTRQTLLDETNTMLHTVSLDDASNHLPAVMIGAAAHGIVGPLPSGRASMLMRFVHDEAWKRMAQSFTSEHIASNVTRLHEKTIKPEKLALIALAWKMIIPFLHRNQLQEFVTRTVQSWLQTLYRGVSTTSERLVQSAPQALVMYHFFWLAIVHAALEYIHVV
jgi:hypothetical protein